jgi:hypothetical protein
MVNSCYDQLAINLDKVGRFMAALAFVTAFAYILLPLEFAAVGVVFNFIAILSNGGLAHGVKVS